MRKRPESISLSQGAEPCRRLRRGSVLLCSRVALLVILAFSVAKAEERQEIYFELSQEYLNVSGSPSAAWYQGITLPGRDESDESDNFEVEPMRLPAQAKGDPILKRIFTVTVADDAANARLERLKRTPGVKWAEIPPLRQTSAIDGPPRDGSDAPPNDPFYPLQWALGAVHAVAGWDISHGDTSVVIAVVDVGTDISHGDLWSQVWTNQAESSGTPGVDDDNNGFIDDVFGWDFVDDDPNPRPNSGDIHGTHVAGIACAATDNGYAIAGASWNCRLMSVRVGSGTSISHGFEGLIYAAANGADVINLSWGSDNPSHVERIAVEYATEQGALVVAAAGNLRGAGPFDHYPAGYDDAIAVASTDDHDLCSPFSNVGTWVDISAPGSGILSLAPNGGFAVLPGTSMATPLVAGAAGLVKAIHPDWTPMRIKAQLESSADLIDSINPAFAGRMGRGRLNIYRALADEGSAVELEEIIVSDAVSGDGDGIIEPGERQQITITLRNPLTLPAEIEARVFSADPLLQIEPLTLSFGVIEGGGDATNQAEPFPIRISANAPDGRTIEARIEATIVPDGETFLLPFEITVRSPYATIENESIALTVTDFGSIGYYDYREEVGVGEGFRFPANGLTALFHGSLMAGLPSGRVSDNAYGNTAGDRYDFVAESRGVALSRDDESVSAKSHFSDDRAESPLNLDVRQTSIALLDVHDNNFAVLEYAIALQPGAEALDSLYVGLYLDWDVIQATDNQLFWDVQNRFGYMRQTPQLPESPHGPYFGAAPAGRIATFQAGVRSSDVASGWTDLRKAEMFVSGFDSANGLESDDWAQLIGVGPLSIALGDTLRVSFVLAAGKTLPELTASLDNGRSMAGVSPAVATPFQPGSPLLIAAYPNPFNGRTTLICNLAEPGPFSWEVIDANGRQVHSGEGTVTTPGRFILPLEAGLLPTGNFLLRLTSGSNQATLPLSHLK